MPTLNEWKDLLKTSAADFRKHKVPKLSASLAYYAIFTLGPMLLIIMFIAKTVWGSEAKGKVYNHVHEILGEGPAIQIQEMIKNATITANGFAAFISVCVLIIAATTTFTEMQDSLNMIWNLSVKKGKGFKLVLRKRLLSFLMIATLGLLLLATLVINALMQGFMVTLQELFPKISVVLIYILNLSVILLVVSFLFAIIFKMLPDARIKWKDVTVGAFATSILFIIGNYCITLYISNIGFGNMYGATGSLVVLLLWIYLSSIILYSGAVFTHSYVKNHGSEIRPVRYAVVIQETMQEDEME